MVRGNGYTVELHLDTVSVRLLAHLCVFVYVCDIVCDCVFNLLVCVLVCLCVSMFVALLP